MRRTTSLLMRRIQEGLFAWLLMLGAAVSASSESSLASFQERVDAWAEHELQQQTELYQKSRQDLHRQLQFTAPHLQSGPDAQGNSYASSGWYDAATNQLHVVGTTYGKFWTHDGSTTDAAGGSDDPACFYAVARLTTTANGSGSMDWTHSELLGAPTVKEGCLDLLVDTAQKRLFLIGHSDVATGQASVLTDFFNPSALNAASVDTVGLVLDYKYTTASATPDAPLQLQGGRVDQGEALTFPVAITGDPAGNAGSIYVASMVATSTGAPNANFADEGDPANTSVLPWSTSFSLLVEQHQVNNPNPVPVTGTALKKTVESGFLRHYTPLNQETVVVADMVQLPDRLIVAGHTSGGGQGFESAGNDFDTLNLDGFVTQLSLSDLTPLSDAALTSTPTYRIASGQADYVTGLCVPPGATDFVYVTGYTNGHLNPDLQQSDPITNANNDAVRAYVMKLQLSDMTAAWIQEFEATAADASQAVARAVACALTPDGNTLYVAGTVENGGTMNLDLGLASSFGGTDIWLAQLGSETGSLNNDGAVRALHQMGSARDDAVAYRQGVHVDAAGNAIVLGNTFGQVYRSRAAPTEQFYADVFCAVFQKDTGAFMLPLDHQDFVSLPPRATLAPSVSPRPTPAPVPTVAPVPRPTPPQDDDNDDEGGGVSWVFLLVLLLVVILAVCGFGIFWNVYHIPKREIATDRSKVLDYLHEYDVEDVELKHSATGGWHCSYVGPLAKGINNNAAANRRSRNAEFEAASSYDPLTASGGRRNPPGFGGGRRNNNKDRFQDEHHHGSNYRDSEEGTFGNNSSRRERAASMTNNNNNNPADGLMAPSAYRDDPQMAGKKKSRSRSSGPTGGADAGSNARRNRAKERWDNREIL